jgi:hypothetical protein
VRKLSSASNAPLILVVYAGTAIGGGSREKALPVLCPIQGALAQKPPKRSQAAMRGREKGVMMRRFSMTMMAAVAALALLGAAPMGWASGSDGGTSGGGGTSGDGGGGSSAPPCFQMSVVATPNPAIVLDGDYGTNIQFVISLTNCSPADQSPQVFVRFTPVTGCSLSTPTLRAQPLVPAGQTVTFSLPWPGSTPACPESYVATATAALNGGSTLVAMASTTFNFINMMPARSDTGRPAV